MIEKKQAITKDQAAVLVGLIQKDQTNEQVTEYLDELAFLAETAGANAIKRFHFDNCGKPYKFKRKK